MAGKTEKAEHAIYHFWTSLDDETCFYFSTIFREKTQKYLMPVQVQVQSLRVISLAKSVTPP